MLEIWMFKHSELLIKEYNKRNFRQLESRIGHSFTDKILLVIALCHPSLKQDPKYKTFLQEQKYNYEKLEFLGDAVLNLAITSILIEEKTSLQEGDLSKLRNFLVSKKTISDIALDLGLNNFIIISKGEKKNEGDQNISNLENCMESLIGALYIELNISKVFDLIKKCWAKYLQYDSFSDPKTQLQEILQAQGQPLPLYEVTDSSGPDNNKVFSVRVSISENVYSVAKGSTKKEAEKAAAKKLLHKIQ